MLIILREVPSVVLIGPGLTSVEHENPSCRLSKARLACSSSWDSIYSCPSPPQKKNAYYNKNTSPTEEPAGEVNHNPIINN